MVTQRPMPGAGTSCGPDREEGPPETATGEPEFTPSTTYWTEPMLPTELAPAFQVTVADAAAALPWMTLAEPRPRFTVADLASSVAARGCVAANGSGGTVAGMSHERQTEKEPA